MNAPSLELDNAFWRFSLACYAAPGVPEECLAAQDALGVDVNLLLFCVWLGAGRGVAIADADILAAEQALAGWQEAVVKPLRSARRALKTMPEMIHPEVKGLRRQIADAELAAEQVEQALLFALPPNIEAPDPARSRGELARANAETLLRRHGTSGLVMPSIERLRAAAVAALAGDGGLAPGG